MDKLFDKYCSYIDYSSLNAFLNTNIPYIVLNDPVFAFFDALCHKISKKYSTDKNTVIYQTMSPYHKKDVIYSILVINNNHIIKKAVNTPICKSIKLYTLNFSDKDIKYLNFSHVIFKNSNKIQQE